LICLCMQSEEMHAKEHFFQQEPLKVTSLRNFFLRNVFFTK